MILHFFMLCVVALHQSEFYKMCVEVSHLVYLKVSFSTNWWLILLGGSHSFSSFENYLNHKAKEVSEAIHKYFQRKLITKLIQILNYWLCKKQDYANEIIPVLFLLLETDVFPLFKHNVFKFSVFVQSPKMQIVSDCFNSYYCSFL